MKTLIILYLPSVNFFVNIPYYNVFLKFKLLVYDLGSYNVHLSKL